MDKTHKFLTVGVIILLILCPTSFFFGKSQSGYESHFNASVMSSVVEITCKSNGEVMSEGTGFIVKTEFIACAVVTNSHVVIQENTEYPFPEISAQFFDSEKTYILQIISFNLLMDVAILSFEERVEGLRPLSLTNSASLEYGQRIYSVGNAAGYGLAVSSGVISVPLVNVRYLGNNSNMVQVDLNLNRGGSGGPLIDNSGNAVGMMTLRVNGYNSSIHGICYAIPSNVILEYLRGM